ncbi:zinc ABC transporter substrate-binding protein [Aerococcaceae bacterium DSM 111176]|nr:zinc ABC transporter substrate-binding protein [Aerococcaceae bacterium DSM 111176]
MKKWMKAATTLAVLLSSLAFGTEVQAQDKIQVKTTFYPVYFLASEIAGDNADVSMLLDGGEDAHSYEVSARDSGEVQESDLFIYQDDEMEFFVQDLLTLIDTNETKVQESTEGIELLSGSTGDHDHDHSEEEHNHEEDHDHEHEEHAEEEGHDHEGHSHEYDPHTWLDPVTYAQQAENVRDALIEVDPDNADAYTENTTALIEELTQLHTEYQEGLQDLENRTIVVQHAAFGYLTHAYDLHQESIAGLSTTQEPSAETLATMQDFVQEHDVKVIYVDPFGDNTIAQTVATSNDAELKPLSTLEIVPEGEDYFSVMRQNLEQLKSNQ